MDLSKKIAENVKWSRASLQNYLNREYERWKNLSHDAIRSEYFTKIHGPNDRSRIRDQISLIEKWWYRESTNLGYSRIRKIQGYL